MDNGKALLASAKTLHGDIIRRRIVKRKAEEAASRSICVFGRNGRPDFATTAGQGDTA